jgi:hypothetical protein
MIHYNKVYKYFKNEKQKILIINYYKIILLLIVFFIIYLKFLRRNLP